MNASDVLNRITGHKVRQRPLLDLLKDTDQKLHARVDGCGTWLHLREWMDSGESRIRHANFCGKFLLCRSCAARRAAKMVVAYHKKVETLQALHPQLIPAMVTLTVKNGHDLGERIQHLKDSAGKMLEAARKGRSKSGRHDVVEWNKVAGSVRAIEITKSKEGWHPHAHVFCLLENYIDQKQLSFEWKQWTGDSKIVGITKCNNGITSGLIECLKYASKLTELEPSEIVEVYKVAGGSRFTSSHGIMRGVPEPDILTDSDEGLTGPYRDYIALWLGNGYRLLEGESMSVLGRNSPQEITKHRTGKLIIERPDKPE